LNDRAKQVVIHRIAHLAKIFQYVLRQHSDVDNLRSEVEVEVTRRAGGGDFRPRLRSRLRQVLRDSTKYPAPIPRALQRSLHCDSRDKHGIKAADSSIDIQRSLLTVSRGHAVGIQREFQRLKPSQQS
jgi:hypothetical protein